MTEHNCRGPPAAQHQVSTDPAKCAENRRLHEHNRMAARFKRLRSSMRTLLLLASSCSSWSGLPLQFAHPTTRTAGRYPARRPISPAPWSRRAQDHTLLQVDPGAANSGAQFTVNDQHRRGQPALARLQTRPQDKGLQAPTRRATAGKARPRLPSWAETPTGTNRELAHDARRCRKVLNSAKRRRFNAGAEHPQAAPCVPAHPSLVALSALAGCAQTFTAAGPTGWPLGPELRSAPAFLLARAPGRRAVLPGHSGRRMVPELRELWRFGGRGGVSRCRSLHLGGLPTRLRARPALSQRRRCAAVARGAGAAERRGVAVARSNWASTAASC